MMSRHISQRGLELIKRFEGFSAQVYRCPAGKWTIGYGHVLTADEPRIHMIDQVQAESLLRQDVGKAEQAVCRLVQLPLTQGQFDALVSFVYNVGVAAFFSSTLLKKLNLGDFLGASLQLVRWDKVGGERLKGLGLRRAAERAMFCEKR
jgi:lysozyme